jgi:hypothetical protein
MSEQAAELNLDGITATLDELVKAADATSVVKSYGGTSVEWSGHVDERGKVAGGGADSGDVGGLDDMMIGKMAQTLIDAGYDAGEIQAFMAAKQKEEDEEEDEDMYGEMGTVHNQRPTAKSASAEGEPLTKARDQFRQDPDIADAVDVSPFLEALTARTAEAIDDIRKSMHSDRVRNAGVDRAMAAAVHQIGTLQKGMATVMHALDERLDLVERQPVPAKGATSLTGARALQKSMPNEAGSGEESLSKSEVIGTLTYMNLEKGIHDIGGRPTGQLAMMLEGGGTVDQQTLDAANGFLAAHPAEAETARNYR